MEAENEDVSMSKQEKKAWVALAVFTVGALYLVWSLFFRGSAQTSAHDAGDFFLLFWVVYYLVSRKDKALVVDERDRQIAAKSGSAGYFALALMVFAAAKLVADWWDGAEVFVQSLSMGWVDGFLMLLLVASLAIQSAVSVYYYWRDRR